MPATQPAPALQAPHELDGTIIYVCPRDDSEWEARGRMYEGNFDPACFGDGDRCPTCGQESDQVHAWLPDTPAGYEAWLRATASAR